MPSRSQHSGIFGGVFPLNNLLVIYFGGIFVLFFKPYLSFPSLQFCVCISREVYVFVMLFSFYLGFLYVLLYSGWLVGLLLVYMFSKERKKKKAWNYKGEKVEIIYEGMRKRKQ